MDVGLVREQFPILKDIIYLDSASTSLTPEPVIEAVADYYRSYRANVGRGVYRTAQIADQRYREAHRKAAALIGCAAAGWEGLEQGTAVFTRNATESINMVARGIRWKRGERIITTLTEHHSNLLPWMNLEKRGVRTVVVPQHGGRIDLSDVEDALSEKTRLVAVTHVTNVLGTVQPVEEVAEIAHDRDVPVLLDAAQSIGHIPVDVGTFDFAAIPGHKGLLGPQGTGALYAADLSSLSPSCLGGGIVEEVTLEGFSLLPPPARFEAGTPNIPGVIGLGAAIGLVEELGVGAIHRHEARLAGIAHDGLSGIPGVVVYSPRGSPVISFNVGGMSPHACAGALDSRRKICVRSGFHCAQPLASSLHPEGTVRASFGCYSTEEEVQALVETVGELADLAAILG